LIEPHAVRAVPVHDSCHGARSTPSPKNLSMSATYASRPWPAPASPVAASGWRFGREVALEPDAAGRRRTALRWALKRNCSITPRQLGAVYLSLCLLAFAISAGFWWQGARVVTAFAGLELACVGIALLAYARHAGDREVLTLAGRSLAVEQCLGGRVERADFRADWLSVEPAAAQGSLVELSGEGRTVRVGRFLRPEMRGAFAQELRRALRGACRPEYPSELK
jgi:uncharacterized membrane protein